ncbi:MAG: MlaD family protein [Chlamydiota bacterium]|nr:MlaD family protein [Chlamydiota bacterium]
MKYNIKTLWVGCFALLGMGLVIWVILFLEPNIGDGKQSLTVRFVNVGGIAEGTRVAFAGDPIGEVVSIMVRPDARAEKQGGDYVYPYSVLLHIDSRVKVYTSDRFTLQTSGLLGEKSIDIVPEQFPEGDPPPLATKDSILYAAVSDPLEGALSKVGSFAREGATLLEAAEEWLTRYGPAMGRLVISLDQGVNEVTHLLREADRERLVEHGAQALENMAHFLKGAERGVNTLNDHDFFLHLGEMSRQLDRVMQGIVSGKGTLGALIQDPALYLSCLTLMQQLSELSESVNQYGLLFNLNKQWQREQLAQRSLSVSMTSSEGLSHYLSHEVEEIEQHIARLATALSRSQWEIVPGMESEMDMLHHQVQTLSQQIASLQKKIPKS